MKNHSDRRFEPIPQTEPDMESTDEVLDTLRAHTRVEARMLFPSDETRRDLFMQSLEGKLIEHEVDVDGLSKDELSRLKRSDLTQAQLSRTESEIEFLTNVAFRGFIIGNLVHYLLAAKHLDFLENRFRGRGALAQIREWKLYLQGPDKETGYLANLKKDFPLTKPRANGWPAKQKIRLPGGKKLPPRWLRERIRSEPPSEALLEATRRSHVAVAHLWAAAFTPSASYSNEWRDHMKLTEFLSRAERYRLALTNPIGAPDERDLYDVMLPGFDKEQIHSEANPMSSLDPTDAHRPWWRRDKDLPVADLGPYALTRPTKNTQV